MKFMSVEKKWLLSWAGCITACVLTYPAGATVALDGILKDGEYGPRVFHTEPKVTGDPDDPSLQSVNLYWSYDNDYVYGAMVGDPSKALSVMSVYIYSSDASTQHASGSRGVYGDGNDIVISGAYSWALGEGAFPSVGTANEFTQFSITGIYYGEAEGIWTAYNETTFVQEFKILRSLIGNYDQYSFGGYFFAEEFQPGVLVPGSAVSAPVPEPTTIIAGALLLLPLGVSTVRKFRKGHITQ